MEEECHHLDAMTDERDPFRIHPLLDHLPQGEIEGGVAHRIHPVAAHHLQDQGVDGIDEDGHGEEVISVILLAKSGQKGIVKKHVLITTSYRKHTVKLVIPQ